MNNSSRFGKQLLPILLGNKRYFAHRCSLALTVQELKVLDYSYEFERGEAWVPDGRADIQVCKVVGH